MRRILTAALAFSVVEYGVWTAVLLYAFDEGGARRAGVVGVLQLLPAAFVAPAVSPLVEKPSRSVALAGTYAAIGAVLVALAAGLRFGWSFWVTIASAVVATTLMSVARPLHYAALPQVAGDGRMLVSATATSGLFDGVGVFLGPVAAGVMAEAFGLAAVPAVGAVLMLIGAGLVVGLRLQRHPARADSEPAGSGSIWSTVRQVGHDVPVMAMLLGFASTFVVISALEIIGVAFAYSGLGAGKAVAGTLAGAAGLGVFAGAGCAAALARGRRLAIPICGALVLGGVCLIAMLSVRSVVPAVALLAGFGAGQAFTNVTGRVLLQRSTSDAALVRIFSVQEGVTMLGLAVGAAAAPLLIHAAGPSGAYAALGTALVAEGVILVHPLNRLDERSTMGGAPA